MSVMMMTLVTLTPTTIIMTHKFQRKYSAGWKYEFVVFFVVAAAAKRPLWISIDVPCIMRSLSSFFINRDAILGVSDTWSSSDFPNTSVQIYCCWSFYYWHVCIQPIGFSIGNVIERNARRRKVNYYWIFIKFISMCYLFTQGVFRFIDKYIKYHWTGK